MTNEGRHDQRYDLWFNKEYNSSTCYTFHLAYVSTLGVCSSVWEANRTLAMRFCVRKYGSVI